MKQAHRLQQGAIYCAAFLDRARLADLRNAPLTTRGTLMQPNETAARLSKAQFEEIARTPSQLTPLPDNEAGPRAKVRIDREIRCLIQCLGSQIDSRPTWALARSFLLNRAMTTGNGGEFAMSNFRLRVKFTVSFADNP